MSGETVVTWRQYPPADHWRFVMVWPELTITYPCESRAKAFRYMDAAYRQSGPRAAARIAPDGTVAEDFYCQAAGLSIPWRIETTEVGS